MEEPPSTEFTNKNFDEMRDRIPAKLVREGRIDPAKIKCEVWDKCRAWMGPDLHKNKFGYTQCAYIEGLRILDGFGPKFQNGCQDRCFTIMLNDSTLAIGIFDGTGDEWAGHVMSSIVSNNIQKKLQENKETPYNKWSEVLLQIFVETDQLLMDKYEIDKSIMDGWGEEGADIELTKDGYLISNVASGSTGVVAIINISEKNATIINLGDSRAILFNPPHFRELSQDQEDKTKRFGNRIQKGGNPITRKDPQIERVAIEHGNFIALVSDGVLNAYNRPFDALNAMTEYFENVNIVKQEDTGVYTKSEKLLDENTDHPHFCLNILRNAERAMRDIYLNGGNPRDFSRDDMSISLFYLSDYAVKFHPAAPPKRTPYQYVDKAVHGFGKLIANKIGLDEKNRKITGTLGIGVPAVALTAAGIGGREIANLYGGRKRKKYTKRRTSKKRRSTKRKKSKKKRKSNKRK